MTSKKIDVFDFKTRVGTGTTASLEGFDALATVVSGGELDLRVVELNEDHLSLIWYLIIHALLERGEEVEPSHPGHELHFSDFQLEFIETPHLRELLVKIDDITSGATVEPKDVVIGVPEKENE
tara:strand:- start:397 stop:768 length:372 start_codon:yes stop_codon:yes gene_type:complete